MIPKEQAVRAGEVLLASAQIERERAAERSTLPLVRIYPSLKAVAPLERHAALRDARGFAANNGASRALLALVSIAFGQVLEQVLMRRHLRQLNL